MDDSNTIIQARKALGRQLAAHRQKSGLIQAGLAALIYYSRSTVANVEAGRQGAGRKFWERCDQVLGADGVLLVARAELAACIGQQHARAANQADAESARSCRAVLPPEPHAPPYGQTAAPGSSSVPAGSPCPAGAGDHQDRRPGAPDPGPLLPADHGLDVGWNDSGLLRLFEDWPQQMLTRRQFMAISGLALTQPAWQALDAPPAVLASAAHDGARVSEPLLQLIEDIVARAQRLDDQQGGAAAAFVGDQFTTVAQLLHGSNYDAATGRRLAAASAQLAQTAGFMSHDAGHDGQGQRWYLAGLRAAHAVGDRGLSASILGLMSNQAVSLGKPGDAIQLGAAALEAASGAPPLVRALLYARGSLAHAANGDLTAFRAAHERTVTLLDGNTTQAEPPPGWAAYVSRTELDAIAGRGLIILARRIPTRRIPLLAEAESLLHGRAHTDAAELPQRSALRHGALLGLAYAGAGDLDHAAAAGRRALSRLPGITSVRSVQVLSQLRQELAAHTSRSTAVSELITDLDEQLPAART